MAGQRCGVVVWGGVWYPTAGLVDGLPAFRFRAAPTGLVTRRQLRAAGLCPGGHAPVAVLVWRRGRRRAWLYRLDVAAPKRQSSAAQVTALGRAMAARRVCCSCGRDVGYCVPTSTRQCWACFSVSDAAA